MSAAYEAFIADKARKAENVGFEADECLFPRSIKDFQRAVTRWALLRGRAAIFEGTGLGKTLQELIWARAVYRHTGGRVLLFAPLAVAQQIVGAEAPKFGFAGEVEYAPDQCQADHSDTPIIVTNYDRAERFSIGSFDGVVLDESSILKAQDGKTRAQLTEACASVPFRLCATATPAPNDWTELGQHSEFLGVMTAKEMLSMYFVHDGSNRMAEDGSSDGWRLKRHAAKDFWAWVASWAVMIRHPRDLGFDEDGYDLPPLRKHQITVAIEHKPAEGSLFQLEAQTLGERLSARRSSQNERIAAALELVEKEPDEPWLIWCGLNSEGDMLERMLPNAEQVAGADSVADKERRLLGFVDGKPLHLVSKPSIAGFGMNWQHCRRMVFVGLNDSFEQLYQAIRRCWRFGQTAPVDVYLIASELEGAVVANLERKEREFEKMQAAMADHMRELTRRALRTDEKRKDRLTAQKEMELPEWLR